MYRTALIVIGGGELRMGNELPRQFLPIGEKSVLVHTLKALHRFDKRMQLILVLPREQQGFWRELCEIHRFSIRHGIADRGETRFRSVKNELALVNDIGGIVGVHDSVRPFVSQEVIARCFREVAVRRVAIPVVGVIETMHHLIGSGSEAVSCNDCKLVQAPRVFDVDLLRRAYGQEFTPLFTDDASVVKTMGVPVHLVEGSHENIKIATPFDLKIASALL